MKNNETFFFYVLYTQSVKTWAFDQSEHAQGPIYIVIINKCQNYDKKTENSIKFGS